MKLILIVTPNTEIRDALQRRLPEFLVAHTTDLDTINDYAKKENPMVAVVIELLSSDDWISLEYLKTAYSNISLIGIIGMEEDQSSDLAELTEQYKAAGFFNSPLSEKNYEQLADLVKRATARQEDTSEENAVKNAVENKIRNVSGEMERLKNEFDVLLKPQTENGIPGASFSWALVEKLENLHRELKKTSFN